MRKLAIVFGVLFSSSAFAQSSGIPWTNGRVLTAPMMQQFDAAKMNLNSLGKPGFAPQLNALGQITNPVVGDVSQAKATSDGQTVAQITEKAANAVQKTDVNSANGVAGLDSNSNATANVANSKVLTGKLLLTVPDPVLGRNYKASFFDNLGDGSTSPDSIIFGGHQNSDSVFMKIVGGAYSHGDNGGTILSVLDTGASTFGSRNGAGLDDSIVIFPKTQDQSPRLSVGQDITDSVDGVSHTVTYGVSSVTISPALPDSEIALIKPRMRLYSNYKNGNSPGDLSTHHELISPYLYYGYVNSVTSNTSSTTITVFSDPDNATPGWFINGATASAAPGSNTGDTIDNTSDTTSSAPGIIFSYSHPALFIGMSNHKFISNPMLQYTGAKNSVTRTGTGAEYDLLLPENMNDYQYSVSGIGINMNTHGKRLADGSSDLYLGGTGVPTMLYIDGGAEGTAIRGQSIYAGPKGFGTPDTSDNPQSQGFSQIMGRFGKYTGVNSSNASTTGQYHTLDIIQQRMTDNSDGTHTNPSDVSISIAEAIGESNPDAYGNGGMDGARQSKIRFWGGDIYLCSYGQGDVTSSSVDSVACDLKIGQTSIDYNKTLHQFDNQFIYNGNSIYMCQNGVGDTNCHNFYGDADGIALSGTMTASGFNTSGNINVTGGLVIPFGTPSSSTSDCTRGQIEMDADYIYSCVATNTWHRISSGASW